ncbi:DUF1206 domain-containing protein [Nocardioides sp. GXZ039]|uniref:DUF1206 domain-containing protein n=1 Tax=Nocardioides sp. GXZ039 TaxID=3136018 RepID=UPI0030F3952A
MTQAGSSARGAAQSANDSKSLDWLAAAGLVAFGVVHLVLGWLVIQLALGDREGEASNSGALAQLAEQPFGKFLVWAIGIGMILLVIWQAIEAAVGHQDEEGKKRIFKRLASAGKAIVYAVIAYSAIKIAIGSGSSNSEKGTDSTTAKIMDLPGGQILVGLIGLGIIGVGIALLVQAYRESYLKKLDGEGKSGKTGDAYRWFGRIGHTAKGIALGIVGGLFLYAAISHEPKKSGGMDQALTTVLDQPFGPVLLILMGLGFIAYGLFCFAWARHLDR